jgi:FKBP-type peptidyl-prolyl cis-trans isomerase
MNEPRHHQQLLCRQAIAAEKKEAKPAGPITSDLCNAECAQKLGDRVKLPSGLEYQDIVEGTGAKPVIGYQVVAQYVAMTPEGRVFDSSIEKKKAYDIRCSRPTFCACMARAGRVLQG